MVWPFKWKLSACTFTRCYLFVKIVKMKFWNLLEICLWPHLAVKGLRRFYATWPWPLMYPYPLGTYCWKGYGFQGLASRTILFKTDQLQCSRNPKALGCIIITHPTVTDVQCTVPLKSKLPVTSRFLPCENHITRYVILLVHNKNRVVRESSNWVFGINYKNWNYG